jgi:hypothetical protein
MMTDVKLRETSFELRAFFHTHHAYQTVALPSIRIMDSLAGTK